LVKYYLIRLSLTRLRVEISPTWVNPTDGGSWKKGLVNGSFPKLPPHRKMETCTAEVFTPGLA